MYRGPACEFDEGSCCLDNDVPPGVGIGSSGSLQRRGTGHSQVRLP